MLPPDSYEYQHPEGTGKGTPPFFSAWFLGGFRSMVHQDMNKKEEKEVVKEKEKNMKEKDGKEKKIDEVNITER